MRTPPARPPPPLGSGRRRRRGTPTKNADASRRFWRHHNGHVWAEVRFVNGDTLTVRSTNLERISLDAAEVAHLETFGRAPADPLELLQRTIDRSVRITADDGIELTNEFDEVGGAPPPLFVTRAGRFPGTFRPFVGAQGGRDAAEPRGAGREPAR